MRIAFIAAALAAVVVAAPSAGGVIVDTGLSDQQFPTAWAVSPNQSLASEFSIASANTLTGVEAYFVDFGTAGDVVFTLYASAGDLPGAALFSQTFAVGSTAGYYGVSGLSLLLADGDYFAGFESAGYDGSIQGDAPNPLGDEAFSFGPGRPFRAFDGTDLSIRVAAVPEASTWTLMIAGFGLVGAALRRRTPLAA